MSYPKVVKEAALEKIFHTDLSFREIGGQLGIPRATLHTWKKQYRIKTDTSVTIDTPAESWPPEEQFAVVLHSIFGPTGSNSIDMLTTSNQS